VRLARVSCGATLPIPGCLQDCNIVSGPQDGEGEGKRGRVAITIRSRSRISSRARSFPRFHAHLSLLLASSLSISMLGLCSRSREPNATVLIANETTGCGFVSIFLDKKVQRHQSSEGAISLYFRRKTQMCARLHAECNVFEMAPPAKFRLFRLCRNFPFTCSRRRVSIPAITRVKCCPAVLDYSCGLPFALPNRPGKKM